MQLSNLSSLRGLLYSGHYIVLGRQDEETNPFVVIGRKGKPTIFTECLVFDQTIPQALEILNSHVEDVNLGATPRDLYEICNLTPLPVTTPAERWLVNMGGIIQFHEAPGVQLEGRLLLPNQKLVKPYDSLTLDAYLASEPIRVNSFLEAYTHLEKEIDNMSKSHDGLF